MLLGIFAGLFIIIIYLLSFIYYYLFIIIYLLFFILTANIEESGLFLTFDPQILTFQDILDISYFSGQNTSKS